MKYRYSGPASGVTLADGSEILLWPGKSVTLPEQHEYVKTLEALGYLTPAPTDTTVATELVPSSKRKPGSESSDKAEVGNAS